MILENRLRMARHSLRYHLLMIFPNHLKLFIVVALDNQHHVLTHHEIGVLVLERVIAHTDHAIGKVAENAAAIFAGDHGEAAGSRRGGAVPLQRRD